MPVVSAKYVNISESAVIHSELCLCVASDSASGRLLDYEIVEEQVAR